MGLHTIALKKYGDSIIKEVTGSGVIYPGMLLQRIYSSANKVKAHAGAAGAEVQNLFAIEDALQGNDIDDAYADGALVRCEHFRSGDEIYAILEDGESVAYDDFLESAGNGYLQAYSSGKIVAVALETKDTSDSSGGESSGPLAYNKRIKVEIV